ncbi:MAG: beta-propeller fold lactonase family protein [Vulcanimicrobiota bacterium]
MIPNVNAGTISVRSINLSNGQTQLVSTPAVGTQPSMVRVHPSRNAFYVSNIGTSNISGVGINSDGSTFVLPGSPYAGPAGARNVHVHPSGKFLYVAGNTQMQSFQVNTDGSLTSLGTANMPTTPRNEGAFTPDGQFLHIPVFNGVMTFAINTTTGLATAGTFTPIATAAPVNDVAISPDGVLLIANCQVAGANNDIIAPFTVGANGTLTALPVNNLNYDVGLGHFASNGVYYVGDVTDANARLFGYTISPGGVLNQIFGSPFAAPGGGSQTVVDPTGNFVFSAANGNSMAVNRRLNDNTLQAATGSPFTDNLTNPFIFDFYQVAVPQ